MTAALGLSSSVKQSANNAQASKLHFYSFHSVHDFAEAADDAGFR